MPHRLLLIDDDESLCEIAALALSRNGFDVETRHAAEEAIEVFEREEFDVVVTDLGLAEDNGFDLLEQLRARAPQVPVLVLSGNAQFEQRSYELGAAAFLLKPATLQELAAKANEAVAANG